MTCSCDCNAIAIRTICQIDPDNISQNPIYSSSIPRCHVVLLVGTFMCLIKGIKLIVMWESLLSHGLTTSKVNVSSARPHGERWMGGQEESGEDVAAGRRIPSWVRLNPSCVSLLRGPRWSDTTGEIPRGHSGVREGTREGGECGGREWAGPLFSSQGICGLN